MFKRTLQIYKDHYIDLSLLLALTFIMSGFSMLSPFVFGKLMDSMIRKQNFWILVAIVTIVPALSAIKDFTRLLRQWIDMHRVWFPIQEYLRMKTIGRYFAFSIGQFRSMHSGLSREIISTGENSMQNLAKIIVTDIAPVVTRTIITCVMLLWLHLPVGLIIVGGITVYGLTVWKMRKKYIPRINQMRDKNLASSKHRGEILAGASLIKSYSKEDVMRDHYKKIYLESVHVSRETKTYTNTRNKLMDMILTVTQWIASIACVYLYTRNKITIGQFVTARMWWQQICDMIEDLGEKYQDVLTENSSAERFLDLIDTPPAVREIDESVHLNDIVGHIRFENVSFSYPRRGKRTSKKVLDGVSFFIGAGENVAIVGTSGSGKSTLITLLQRGYDPDTGIIEVDGINLRNLDLKEYYRHVAIVDQNALTIDMSIGENIRLGTHEQLSDADVLMFCQMVDLDINEFEDGLETRVGEMGNGITGGERQRIAIARALAGNPRILIFDEPTSSLDAMTEARVKRTIDIASKGRTTITIAHRLSTIQNADRIFMMEKGHITAMGTHRELLSSSGTYMAFAHEQKISV